MTGFTNGSVVVHFQATVEEVEEVTVAVEADVSIEERLLAYSREKEFLYFEIIKTQLHQRNYKIPLQDFPIETVYKTIMTF